MAKRTTLYVALAILISVAVIATFVTRNVETFGTPSGVRWCTPKSCTTRTNTSLSTDNVDKDVKTLSVSKGYQAQFGTGTQKKCITKGRIYPASNTEYKISDTNIGCIYSGQVSTATSV
jgi:hypothetical protein